MKNFFSNKHKPQKISQEAIQLSKTPEENNTKLVDDILIESEMRYRRLFESAKDGILILDFETGKIVDANPFIIKIIDHPLKEIFGKQLWEIGLFINKEESEIAFIELKTNGYIRFEDMPIQRPDGKITEVEFISNVYLVNELKVIQCNVRDITERKLIEKALKENEQNLKKQNADYLLLNQKYLALNEELAISLKYAQEINNEMLLAKNKAEESDKLKSAFLSNISHEIRTPMNAILGFSEFLLEPGLSAENMKNYVQIINSSCQQLLSVISDIVDISKIETGQIIILSEFVNVNNLLNDLLATYRKIVDPEKLQLKFSATNPNDLIQIKSDGNRIKQVFCNLLNNSIKFTKEGEIEFGYKTNPDFITFYVKDTGIGITQENQKFIFERFRQVETSIAREYGGNGLGLSISKALVEKMGGKITVNSEIESGSTFTFTIPYVKSNPKVDNPALKSNSDRFKNLNHNTILIVEDEKYNYAYLNELLASKKVKIIHAWNGIVAVEKVKNNLNISLVLMDIKMPLMNGYEARQIIKQIRPELPIIAQTAFALSHDKEDALKAGFDSYLSKPTDKNLILETINSFLF
jgi:PAS domain S-box-containing protein